jgi:hypothetical protein
MRFDLVINQVMNLVIKKKSNSLLNFFPQKNLPRDYKKNSITVQHWFGQECYIRTQEIISLQTLVSGARTRGQSSEQCCFMSP